MHSIQNRYRTTGIHADILHFEVIITADTGFSNGANDEYLKEEDINAYIPDNQFRSRDKSFERQKQKYGKRHQDSAKGLMRVILAS